MLLIKLLFKAHLTFEFQFGMNFYSHSHSQPHECIIKLDGIEDI
jgi:hypothetical protein